MSRVDSRVIDVADESDGEMTVWSSEEDRLSSSPEVDFELPAELRKRLGLSHCYGNSDWQQHKFIVYAEELSHNKNYTFKCRLNFPSDFFVKNYQRIIELLADTNKLFGFPVHSFKHLTPMEWVRSEAYNLADFYDYGQVTCYLAEDFGLERVVAFFQRLQHVLVHSLSVPKVYLGMMPRDTPVGGCANVSFRLERVGGVYIDSRLLAITPKLSEALNQLSAETPGYAVLSGKGAQLARSDNIHTLMRLSFQYMLATVGGEVKEGWHWFKLATTLRERSNQVQAAVSRPSEALLGLAEKIASTPMHEKSLVKYKLLLEELVRLCAVQPACGVDKLLLRQVKSVLNIGYNLPPDHRREIKKMLLAVFADNTALPSDDISPLLASVALRLFRLLKPALPRSTVVTPLLDKIKASDYGTNDEANAVLALTVSGDTLLANIASYFDLLDKGSPAYQAILSRGKQAFLGASAAIEGYTATVFKGVSAKMGAAAAIEVKLAEPSAGAGVGGPSSAALS
ncbi:MAG: hypothetical protein P1U40_06140 [Coxiellaceae bacterium]|nr:hypothetical protein [Coxiellaceae bacterium]